MRSIHQLYQIFGKSDSNSNYGFPTVLQTNNERGDDDLVTFNGSGKYNEPELSWQDTVAPTSVAFFDSNKLGYNYQNDMFVSTAGGGKIYNFDLSQDRKQLVWKDILTDKVVDSEIIEDLITFADGFGMITDLEMNPYDGSLYVVTPITGDSAGGSVYKIVAKSPDTILFPSAIKSIKGNGQLFPEDNDLVICDKLLSFDKELMDEWEQGHISDKQAVPIRRTSKNITDSIQVY